MDQRTAEEKTYTQSYRSEVIEDAEKIGLARELFLHYIDDVSDSILNTQPSEFWIKRYLERSNSNWLPSNEFNSYKQLGFNNEKARELSSRILPHFANYHDALYYAIRQTAENSISDELEENITLDTNETSATKQVDVNGKSVTFYIFKKSRNADIKGVVDLSDTNSQYWFHGTTGTNAENIMDNGIDPRDGVPEQDFSNYNRRGFYLYDNLDAALNWSDMTWADPVGAVLVYKLDKELLSNDSKHKDVRNDEETWRKVVSTCRSSKKHLYDKKVTSIYGPTCTNGCRLAELNRTEKDYRVPTPGDDNQLVLLESKRKSVIGKSKNKQL